MRSGIVLHFSFSFCGTVNSSLVHTSAKEIAGAFDGILSNLWKYRSEPVTLDGNFILRSFADLGAPSASPPDLIAFGRFTFSIQLLL